MKTLLKKNVAFGFKYLVSVFQHMKSCSMQWPKARSLPAREESWESAQSYIQSLTAIACASTWTSFCWICQAWTLEIQISSCANQTGDRAKRAISLAQECLCFMFLALLWGISMVHSSQGNNHSRCPARIWNSKGFGSIETFCFWEGCRWTSFCSSFTACKMAIRVLYQAL